MFWWIFERWNRHIERARRSVSSLIGGLCLQIAVYLYKQVRSTFERDRKPDKDDDNSSGRFWGAQANSALTVVV